MAFKDAKRCKARSKTTGKQCKNPAVKGVGVCRMHGAHTNGSKRPGRKPGSKKPPGSGRGAERGNTRAMTYSAYTPKLPAHLVEARESMLARYLRSVDNLTEIDRMALERAASLEAKLAFALADPECPASTLDTLHRLLHVELKSLKVTRVQRTVTNSGTTPAEVIGAIMLKVAERRRQIEEDRRLEAPRPALPMSEPARRGAVTDVGPPAAEQDIAEDDGTLRGEALQQQLAQWAAEDAAAIAEDAAPDPDPEPELLEDDKEEGPADQAPALDDDWFPED